MSPPSGEKGGECFWLVEKVSMLLFENLMHGLFQLEEN